MSEQDTVEETNLSVEDLVKELNDDSDESETLSGDETKDSKKTSSDKEEGTGKDKEDDETPDEDDDKPEDEEIDIENIPKRKDVLKAFPEFDKKFPGIFKAVYREQEYNEVFPTPNDAKEAAERLNNFGAIEQSLLEKGSIEETLEAVRNTDKGAYDKLIGNIIPTIAKLDNNAYLEIAGEFVAKAAIGLMNAGRQAKDENQQAAALILAQFYGINEQVMQSGRMPQRMQQNDDIEQKFKEREEKFTKQLLDNAIDEVKTRASNGIKSVVERIIDPKQQMSNYVRRNAVKDAMSQIDDMASSDTRFQSVVDKLWKQARDSNFNESSKVRIRNAILSKAKTILPDVIRKVRNEALRDSSNNSDERKRNLIDDEDDEKPKLKINRQPPSTRQPEINKPQRAKRTIDFLNE